MLFSRSGKDCFIIRTVSWFKILPMFGCVLLEFLPQF
jgi:hypothetical protein